MVPIVSIIMPARNTEKYIGTAIDSVLAQDYTHWELLIADDHSTDLTPEIVSSYAARDSRIIPLAVKTEFGTGAATARNYAIQVARGRYIAFLDSDDAWLPKKLSIQLRAIARYEAVVCFSAYKKMDYQGKVSRGIVRVPATTSYSELLKSNVIGCLTAIYDTARVGKVFMPAWPLNNINQGPVPLHSVPHEDYAMWLRMARQQGRANAQFAVGVQEPLAIYRVHKESVSHHKLTAAQYQWRVYRRVEGIPLHAAIYNFCHYAVRGYRKYLIT